ncbi:MAG: IclR family transcriptional regulator [Castellaniella sp.]|uniref:IclR family transcriptional regulator n=1 Tax=Castellaniella sp. TaxID=1955812 RepID=UPI001219BD15|nr:IclR family transcriptional regulator [Castellaniella sp.]TAN28043.1 MAG: IclR family transcriptional regulator [Castellaniella sp.]
MTSTTAQKKAGTPRPRRQRVQSIATGMRILKGLAQLGGRASLTVLSRHVAENPAKVHRYITSLTEEGLVSQDPASAHYLLGAEAIHVGLAAMRLADPIRAAEAELIHLREKLEMTCFIAVMGNKGPTIVRFEEPGLPVTLNVRVGSVLPLLWSATGRVCLGFLDDSRVSTLAQDELGQASPERRVQLDRADPIGWIQREVRSAGMAIVRDTNLQGISAIAVPIFDFTERARAILTVLGTTGSFDTAADGDVATLMLEVAESISSSLGHSRKA